MEYPSMQFYFEEIANDFLSTIKYEAQRTQLISADVVDKVTNKVTDKVTDNQNLILQFIGENVAVSSQELADRIGISQRKIKENIAKLKTLGRIERIGNTKSGFWKIK
jgi:ATP-dependent DNA helicase RecG